MDRDNRWDRVEAAYNALFGDAPYQADSPVTALEAAYARGEQDEFVKPTIVSPQARLLDGDAILFLNFRADRARELTQALTFADFDGFKRKYRVQPGYFATITAYGTQFSNSVMFEKQPVNNGLGEFLAGQGLSQLRIAETEKYPHVTYFFSGGREEPYIGEERIMIPSPKVTTYDLQPEMSAVGITEQIIDSLKHHRHDVIICNFANGDMVGHTGSLDAAIKAVETLDSCVAQVVETTLSAGGEVIITADHGNCEHMYDEKISNLTHNIQLNRSHLSI